MLGRLDAVHHPSPDLSIAGPDSQRLSYFHLVPQTEMDGPTDVGQHTSSPVADDRECLTCGDSVSSLSADYGVYARALPQQDVHRVSSDLGACN